jgi:hypothetical protein
LLDQANDFRLDADIGGHCQPANLRGNLPRRIRPEIGHDDAAGARGSEAAAKRSADATGTASDHYDFVGKIHVRSVLDGAGWPPLAKPVAVLAR